MLDDKKELDVEVIDDEPEDKDTPSDVTVDLDKKVEPTKVEPKPEPQRPQVDLSKLHNTIAFQTRKFEQAMKEIGELKTQLQKANTPKEVSEIKDEIDEIAQRDWKAGVKKVVETQITEAVTAALKKRDDEVSARTKREGVESLVENSKKQVLDRYPEVEVEGSDYNRFYIQAINEEPDILSNPRGPYIAMKRMEELMQDVGITPRATQKIVDKEANRLIRAGASSIVGRRPSSNGKITLTREQKEFCEHYKIPFDQYAKNLKADEARGGVEA